MRNLLITRRVVPLDRLDDYAAAWAAVTTAAAATGARAWLFRKRDHEDRFTEFVEWAGGAPLESEPLASALLELDALGAAHDGDIWEEAVLS